jgi:hypothetical protein
MHMNETAVPLRVQHAAMQSSIDKSKANFEKNKELSNLLEEIREKCTKEINALLGSKAKQYREFHEKSREIARTMQPMFTATSEGRRIKSQFQKTRIDESNKFIKNLGINVNDFKSIISKYQKESNSIIEKTRAIKGSLNLEASPIPAEVIHPEPDSPWLSIHPPYFYSHGNVYFYYNAIGTSLPYYPWGQHNENHLTGKVSCESRNEILGGGDYSAQIVSTSSIILIYFQMPASGRLNIWSQWQCVKSSYGGWLSDDFGWSDGSIRQSSILSMSVGEQLGAEEAHYTLLDFRRHVADDRSWSDNMAMPGQHIALNLVTDIPYSAGQGVLLSAGIVDFNDAVLNDMSHGGGIENSWMLRGVWVSAINP